MIWEEDCITIEVMIAIQQTTFLFYPYYILCVEVALHFPRFKY
jgi:hypothetical protein